jgi:hypothetical protein
VACDFVCVCVSRVFNSIWWACWQQLWTRVLDKRGGNTTRKWRTPHVPPNLRFSTRRSTPSALVVLLADLLSDPVACRSPDTSYIQRSCMNANAAAPPSISSGSPEDRESNFSPSIERGTRAVPACSVSQTSADLCRVVEDSSRSTKSILSFVLSHSSTSYPTKAESSSSPESQGTLRLRKRKQVKLACSNCRRNHTACDRSVVFMFVFSMGMAPRKLSEVCFSLILLAPVLVRAASQTTRQTRVLMLPSMS